VTLYTKKLKKFLLLLFLLMLKQIQRPSWSQHKEHIFIPLVLFSHCTTQSSCSHRPQQHWSHSLPVPWSSWYDPKQIQQVSESMEMSPSLVTATCALCGCWFLTLKAIAVCICSLAQVLRLALQRDVAFYKGAVLFFFTQLNPFFFLLVIAGPLQIRKIMLYPDLPQLLSRIVQQKLIHH